MNNAYMSLGNMVGPSLAGIILEWKLSSPFILRCIHFIRLLPLGPPLDNQKSAAIIENKWKNINRKSGWNKSFHPLFLSHFRIIHEKKDSVCVGSMGE